MGEIGENSGGIQVLDGLDFQTEIHITDSQLQHFAELIEHGGVDIREKLAEFNPLADEFQKAVINSKNSTIRVVAPAGSGKTQTVINRAIEQMKLGVPCQTK